MRIMKRWLTAMLTISIALSDCSSISVLAVEKNAEAGPSVSENSAALDEVQDDNESLSDGDMNISDLDIRIDNQASETKLALPALHIGQVKNGEDLPSPDDDEFTYDLPVSFEMSNQIVLFANHNLNTVLETENGTLVWSILRGEKGTTPGSTSLINEDDDWTDFKTVSSSPYFLLKENKDKDSDYYQTVEIVLKDALNTNAESYDYYIRAAYYPETENAESEIFYAAATVPFLPQNTDTEEIQDDTAAIEDTQSYSISDNTTSVENTAQEEMQDKEAVDAALDDMDADDTVSLEEDSNPEQAQESVSENSEAAKPLSVLLENEDEGDAIPQPTTTESFGVLTLDAEKVTLHIEDTLQIRATLKPKNTDAVITWTSSDNTIVSVLPVENDVEKKDGSYRTADIKALAAGKAEITAEYGDMKATVKVNVLYPDENEVYDLSGDIWVSGFQRENEELVYTGQKITQSFQVYHKETLLKEKTDYTLTYKNNVNAAEWNAVKAPSVTITMKGQYQGSTTLYYTIYPADIKGLDIYNSTKENDGGQEASSGYKQTVNYSKTIKIPNPELTLGKKKLAVNKDFVCDYSTLPKDYKKGASYEVGKVYHYTVKGTGNFTGSFQMQLVVVKNKNFNFSSASVTLSQKQYEYHGEALSKTDIEIKHIKFNKQTLDPTLYDYDIYAKGIEGAYLMVYPTVEGENAGYYGFKKVALKLVGDRDIKNAALETTVWKANIPFSQKTVNEAGGLFQETKGVLTFGEGDAKEALTEGQDYTVKYTNAKKVGTVTATFTGKGRYKGTVKKKYKIVPNNNKNNFTIRWKNVTREDDALVISYQKGGAVPDFVLLEQDNNVLKNKTDYTVKLKNNKKLGNMTCEITGKGNYKGYLETVQITVKNGDISQCTLTLPDKPYSTKKNEWKAAVTVKDVNGKALAAGTDYVKPPVYEYENMESGESPAVDSIVTVTVTGKNCYENSSITGSYRIFDKNKNISKWIVTIDPQIYTGKQITLSHDDIHVYASNADKKAKKELDATSCYQIVEYKNNIKAGTARVTLRGIGEYGGTKTCSFKIQKKAYLTNHVAKIKLDKTKLNISLAQKGKSTLTAIITPKDASQQLTNPTIIWTTSNSNIATVEAVKPVANDKTDTETDTNHSISATAAITVYKAGTVKITAIAQDGNKKAACTVTISVPVLKEKGKTIRSKTSETYQLSFVGFEIQEMDTTLFKFESTNLKVASVDKDGLVTMKRFGLATIKVSFGSSVQQCSFVVERDKANDDELTKSNGVLTYNQASGCKDDAAAINALLRQAEWSGGTYDTVYIPAGTYHINAVPTKSEFGGLILTDNQNLIMADGATLNVLPNGSTGYHAIWAFGRNNVTISGGKIVGDYTKGHKSSSGEWGHGIQISGCTNVYISDVEVSYCWGDGIYLGFYDGPNKSSNRVTIEKCNLHHNRRNNLSITDASNITVSNCQFNNAKGADPQYGIDIEPNAGRTCSNVTISNSTFKGNAKGTIQILGQLNAHVKGVTIENCTGDKKPLVWSGFGGSVSGVTQKGNKW